MKIVAYKLHILAQNSPPISPIDPCQVGSVQLDLSAHAKELLETAPEKLKDKDTSFFPGVPLDGPFQIFQYYTRITNGVFNIGGKRMTVEIRCQTQLQLGTGPAIAGPRPGKRCSKSILIHCIAGSGRGLPVRIRELLWHVERSCG